MEEHPQHPISISAFTKLRPKNCVFARSTGTHFVCVCTLYKNPKLKLNALNIETLTKSSQYPVRNYKDCLKLMMCQKPSPFCHLSQYEECPGTNILSQLLRNCLDTHRIENVLCSQWTSTD